MKDALGHGSNGDGTLQEQLRARLTHVSILKGGAIPQSSNAAAASSLAGSLRRTQEPVHPSMAPVINAPKELWSDRSAEQEYNRALVTRIRNGDVGRRGM